MAYFSLGQLLTDIDGNKKAYNQANYVLSEGGFWIPMRASNAGEVFTQLKDSIVEIGGVTGSIVEIGGVTFAVSGGDTLRGKSANKPDAAAAHAVIPFCYYFSVDTGIVEVTDGTNWVVI